MLQFSSCVRYRLVSMATLIGAFCNFPFRMRKELQAGTKSGMYRRGYLLLFRQQLEASVCCCRQSQLTLCFNASYEQTMWILTYTCRGRATLPSDVMRERINTADFVSRCLAVEVVQTPKNAVSGSLPVRTTALLCTPLRA